MDFLEKHLKNNKKVEIELFLNNNTIKSHKTGFYKLSGDKYTLYRPKEEISIEENQELRILVYTKDGIFVFKTKVISVNSKLLEIQKPKDYLTVQRRELLRAELCIPFVLEISSLKQQEYKTENISGSGFSFYGNEILDKNGDFKVRLKFKDRTIVSKIKVIEIRKNLKTGLPKYRYSVKLLSLNNTDENYIAKQCIINNIQTVNI